MKGWEYFIKGEWPAMRLIDGSRYVQVLESVVPRCVPSWHRHTRVSTNRYHVSCLDHQVRIREGDGRIFSFLRTSFVCPVVLFLFSPFIIIFFSLSLILVFDKNPDNSLADSQSSQSFSQPRDSQPLESPFYQPTAPSTTVSQLTPLLFSLHSLTLVRLQQNQQLQQHPYNKLINTPHIESHGGSLGKELAARATSNQASTTQLNSPTSLGPIQQQPKHHEEQGIHLDRLTTLDCPPFFPRRQEGKKGTPCKRKNTYSGSGWTPTTIVGTQLYIQDVKTP